MGACRGYFPRQGEKKPWNACGASAQGFEFAAVYFGNWLPLGRSSVRRARVLAEDLAFRQKAQGRLLGAAQNAGIICWKSGVFDGYFSLRKRRWAGVAHGYKGKGVFLLTLMEFLYRHVHLQKMKMKGSMLEMFAVKTGKSGR